MARRKESGDRPEFTAEMRRDYTILLPNMCSIHFEIIKNVFLNHGYKVELLTTTGREIVDEGLKYVHNDTCYPALLTIGQMMNALHSGKYDLNKVALVMTQTGGGCRASNYIHLLRKALQADGLGHIPVISLSAAGLEKNSGFKITLPMLRAALAGLLYGDELMLLSNQTRPYEKRAGETDALVAQWVGRLSELFRDRKAYQRRVMPHWLEEIERSFASIPRENRPEVIKVGIVGEIYVKYSPLANNHLEEFLASQGCEVMVPGLLGFLLYCTDNPVEDIDLYGGTRFKRLTRLIAAKYLRGFEDELIRAVERGGNFTAPWPHEKLFEAGKTVIGSGCKMGEGWLLTAEMVELISHGYSNIVCTQPFGCLPNHIVGKGMIRKLRERFEGSNIVAIDYDPGATRVNQENRIKLMLAVARENMAAAETRTESAHAAV
ncbi:MAG: 2-hydroxyacyl-CoA dehydratase [Oscillospiraceae bacterium]|nr:2-hydroxyacyl-CoA dehydratase [Oscillospiraceae bacterium]